MAVQGSLANAFQNAVNNPYLDPISHQRQIEEMLRMQALMGQYTSRSVAGASRTDSDDNLVLLLLTK